jgi:hypothetical protein
MTTAALAAALLCLAPSVQAKLKTPPFAPPPAAVGASGGESAEKVLRVQVEAEYDGMAHTADFLVAHGNQSNYVQGGETAFSVETEAGKGLEFKKWGFVVNVLPVEDPSRPGRVSLEMQVEVSGPVRGKDGVEVRTWQLQTALNLVKGKPKTVSRGSGKMVVTVSDDAD